MSALEHLNPRKVWKYFEEINNIPRGSGNEKEVSDYIVAFAKERGLWVYQDKFWNVLIKKPATQGYENSPAVILQGHIDMVCEKLKDSNHDFTKDPIKMYVDGDFVKAEGTTLGADNGIAVAMCLALLDNSAVMHPALEILFTSDEETGMIGAINFDYSLLEGKRLINLDTEEEGHLLTCCAGGLRAKIALPIARKAAEEGKYAFKVMISGLKGGHSGADIHLGRANANKLMGRLLEKLMTECDCDIAEINGGAMDNAITRDAEAVVLVNDMEAFTSCLEEMQNVFRNEYEKTDGNITISAEGADKVEAVFDTATSARSIAILNKITYGIVAMSQNIKGLVQTSSNIGVVSTEENEITFTSAVRSAVDAEKWELVEVFKALAEENGAEFSYKGVYPAWEYREVSPLRDSMVKTFERMFWSKMHIDAIHAGLECGLFSGKMPDVDMVSIGPDMADVHTPDERVGITSVNRTYNYLIAVLKNLK
ncbi:MAG: aminoacyl-histidine dipeptidase [Firmicutes bacterium]|nr:aminoacyl-histidine dipeptidase [Bacillota bacterium]